MSVRVAAVDLGATSGRVMVGRGRRRTRLDLEEVHRFPNGAVPADGRLAALGRRCGIHREVLVGLRRGRRAGPGRRRSASTRGRSTTACSTRRRAARRPRSATATRAPTASPSRCVAEVGAERAVRRDRPAAAAVQHALPAGRAGTPRCADADDAAADPRPARLLAHRRVGRRAHQRLDHRAATTSRPASGRPTLLDRLGLPRRRCSRRWSSPGDGRRHAAARGRRRGRAAAGDAGDRGRLARHRLGGGRRARRRRDAFGLHLLGHLVAGRPRARRAGADRGGPRGRLHQRGRRRRHDPLPHERDGPVGALRSALRSWGEDGDRPARPARRGGRGCRPLRRRSSTSTTRGCCRPGDMPARIAALARRARASRCRRRRASIARLRPGQPGAGLPPRTCGTAAALAGRRRRGGARRRRRLAERAALPAHRRRAAGCRCVAGPVEATALGNVLVQARALGVDLPDLAAMRALVARRRRRYELRPASTGPGAPSAADELADEGRAAWSPASTTRCSPTRARPWSRCCAGSASTWSSRRRRPAAGSRWSTPATSTRRCRRCATFVDAFAAYDASSRRPARAPARPGTSTAIVAERSGDPGLQRAVARDVAEGLRAVRVPRRRARRDRRGRVLPAHGHLPPDLPLAADARRRRPAASAAASRCAGCAWSTCRGPTECCGFGGTFAMKNADTSIAMGSDKARHVRRPAPRCWWRGTTPA